METPEKPQGFARIPVPLNFTPKPGTPFNDAVLRVSQLSFEEVRRIKNWIDLFPYPELQTTLRPAYAIGSGIMQGKSVNEQRLEWEKYASQFFAECKTEIEWQISRLTHQFNQNLELWASRGRPINADAKLIANSWCGQNSEISLADFCRLNITAQLIKPFYQEFAQKWATDRGLTDPSTSPLLQGKDLDDRGKEGQKRGPYKKVAQDSAIVYFKDVLSGDIERAIRSGKELNQRKMTLSAFKKTENQQTPDGSKYSKRALGGWLCLSHREAIFSELCQQISDRINNISK